MTDTVIDTDLQQLIQPISMNIPFDLLLEPQVQKNSLPMVLSLG